jgi:hypothetical protein
MDRYELLAALEEGLENGRIAPHIAAFIAAELLGVAADETDYHEWAGRLHQPEEAPEELVTA